jgi:HEAT repeat protein
VVLLPVIGVTLFALRPALRGLAGGERFSHGKPARYWVEAIERPAGPEMERQAIEALQDLGEEAVPGLLNVLKSADPQARIRAIKALQALGKRARAAEPALREALRDRATSAPAVRALCRVGPRASTIEAIVQAGWGPAPRVGSGPIVAVRWDGADGSEEVRRAFAEAVRPLVAECTPALSEALRSGDVRVRRVVSACLEQNAIFIKKPSERLLSALILAAGDPDRRVRENATEVLRFLRGGIGG